MKAVIETGDGVMSAILRLSPESVAEGALLETLCNGLLSRVQGSCIMAGPIPDQSRYDVAVGRIPTPGDQISPPQ